MNLTQIAIVMGCSYQGFIQDFWLGGEDVSILKQKLSRGMLPQKIFEF